MENEIRSHLEELKLSQPQIDGVIALLEKKAPPLEAAFSSQIQALRDELAAEFDPTRRAQLAARIISMSLDNSY